MTNKIQNKIYAIEEQGRTIFFSLSSCVVLALGLYIFLLAGTFMGGVERQELVRQANLLHSQVQELESKYMSLNNMIDVEYAKTRGFVAVNNANTEYVALNSDSDSSLTLNR
jgi:hypothetical protein